jgi:hypothetical protein
MSVQRDRAQYTKGQDCPLIRDDILHHNNVRIYALDSSVTALEARVYHFSEDTRKITA